MVDGFAIDGQDDKWGVQCPECGHEMIYTGYFDPDDECICLDCLHSFTTKRVWLDDEHYMV